MFDKSTIMYSPAFILSIAAVALTDTLSSSSTNMPPIITSEISTVFVPSNALLIAVTELISRVFGAIVTSTFSGSVSLWFLSPTTLYHTV